MRASFPDKLTRRVVGWAVAAQMSADLVGTALEGAIRRGLVRRGAIVPTDQGTQYVSGAYRSLLGQYGLRQSLSGCGNCYDNALLGEFLLALNGGARGRRHL